MRKLMNGVAAGVTLSYPLGVYFGIQYIQPWQIAAILAALLLVRLLLTGAVSGNGRFLWAVALFYCGVVVWSNDLTALRFYPALINLGLLTVFAASLWFPPPLIERLARLQNPNLPPKGVRYTRKVTQIWCVFFLLNGTLAVITARWCSFYCWSLYNGLIAYLLMGSLMLGEYWIRVWTQDYGR